MPKNSQGAPKPQGESPCHVILTWLCIFDMIVQSVATYLDTLFKKRIFLKLKKQQQQQLRRWWHTLRIGASFYTWFLFRLWGSVLSQLGSRWTHMSHQLGMMKQNLEFLCTGVFTLFHHMALNGFGKDGKV